MKGSYLRTNYRLTGGQLDITALGGGIPLSSAAGGAGTDKAYAGMMLFSMAMTMADDSVGVAAGFTAAFGDSTYGTMSLYYGGAKYNSGYKFFPVQIFALSVDESAYGDQITTTGSAADLMPQKFVVETIANSGSIWKLSMLWVSTTGSCTNASTQAARLLIAGFIVSSP